jgi:ElaB/YqjD/DUF883 family membrane-anchored ribosome-binding protein
MADKTPSTDGAELERQLVALREDFAGVVTLLRTMAEDRASDAASRARASTDALTQEAVRHGRDARDAVDTTVRNNPFTSLGAAVALGFALGALTRR